MCPLCHCQSYTDFYQDEKRPYLRCKTCLLVFVPQQFHLSTKLEKTQYELHNNDIYDERYRQFLSRVLSPMITKIAPNSKGLDFGCGPGPALAELFKDRGHKIELYDIYFQPNKEVLKKTYDFITSTEVVEHLRDPKQVLESLWGNLKTTGWLGLMTKLVIDQESFKTWHYKNDPTHISFFSKETFTWLANTLNANLTFYGKDVILLQKL